VSDKNIGAALLAAAGDFRARIVSERDCIEASQRLPEDLARELARAGFFRIFLPAAYGGLDTAPVDGIASSLRPIRARMRARGAPPRYAACGARMQQYRSRRTLTEHLPGFQPICFASVYLCNFL
jgi:alkylation response protein AidB-like acyl-CoA dehydrogenase